ncbi:unnamed protein product [Prunus armeniaca]
MCTRCVRCLLVLRCALQPCTQCYRHPSHILRAAPVDILHASCAAPVDISRHLSANSVDSSHAMLLVYCAAAMSSLPSPSPKHMSFDLVLLHECTSYAHLACLDMV